MFSESVSSMVLCHNLHHPVTGPVLYHLPILRGEEHDQQRRELERVSKFFMSCWATVNLSIIIIHTHPIHSNYLREYYNENDTAVREKWDFLQSRLRCCGLEGDYGYTAYQNIGPHNGNRFPDSCCHDYSLDDDNTHCSSRFPKSVRNTDTDQIASAIYLRGCIDILRHLYKAS